MNIFKKAEGFTLVEIMIVVGIIAILAGIFLVGAGRFRNAANDAKIKADVQEIISFEEVYFTKTGSYDNTSTLSGLTGAGFTIPTHPIVSGDSGAGYSGYTDASTKDYVCGSMSEKTGYSGTGFGIAPNDVAGYPLYCIPVAQ